MATQQDVKAAFKIESASVDVTNTQLSINYVHGSTPSELPLTLKNVSNDFFVKAYPVSSTSIMKLFNGATEINQSSPVLIPTASSLDVSLRLVGDLDSRPTSVTLENLQFNLIAAKYAEKIQQETVDEETTSENNARVRINWRRENANPSSSLQYAVTVYDGDISRNTVIVRDAINSTQQISTQIPLDKLISIRILTNSTIRRATLKDRESGAVLGTPRGPSNTYYVTGTKEFLFRNIKVTADINMTIELSTT